MSTRIRLGCFDDGSVARVQEVREPLPGTPHLLRLPEFFLEDTGERLSPAPDDTDLTRFVALHTRRRVVLLPPK